MANLVIRDLEINEELDRKAMDKLAGGFFGWGGLLSSSEHERLWARPHSEAMAIIAAPHLLVGAASGGNQNGH